MLLCTGRLAVWHRSSTAGKCAYVSVDPLCRTRCAGRSENVNPSVSVL